MASIMERMATIVKANINDLIDYFEDPAKIIDQTIADAKVEYAKIKKESLEVLANENLAKKALEDITAEADKWHEIAGRALKAGNEGDARKALENEARERGKLTKQEAIYAGAKLAADKLREKLNDIEAEIKDMEEKAEQIKAMAITAKATKAAARVSEKGIDRGAFEAFARMEAKAERQMAEAEVLEEMHENSVVEQEKSLEEKYAVGAPDGTEDALQALKDELGL